MCVKNVMNTQWLEFVYNGQVKVHLHKQQKSQILHCGLVRDLS
jgi:hypothetical protein